MLYAMYTLFLPADIVKQWVDRWQSGRIGSQLIRRPMLVLLIASGLMLLCTIVVIALTLIAGEVNKQGVIDSMHRVFVPGGMILWFAWALICMAWFVRVFRMPWNWATTVQHQYRPAQVAFAIFPLLLLLNGLSPYIGLKTHHGFAMFSNLRTEAHLTNHLFLPVSVRVVDWEDDAVAVLASDPGGVAANVAGERYTWFEFRRMMIDVDDDVSVTYQRGNAEPVTVSRATNAADEVFSPPPYLYRKLFLLKEIPKDHEPCPCRH